MSNPIWHPFTQEKTAPEVIKINYGEGAYLYTDTNQRLFDGISSWWVNLHGHSHPYLAQKIYEQALKLEHVIFAGFTHEPAETLAKGVLNLLPEEFTKVFYSDNGSTAVEVAVKMCFKYWANHSRPKMKAIAFRQSYHGDTFGAMSVADRDNFNSCFDPLLFEVFFISPPLRSSLGKSDPSRSLQEMQEILDQHADVAFFIFEPIIQGAGGMQMQDIAVLDQLIALARSQGVLTIADEVMTGFGRTGKNFAIEHLENKPDIICVAKGLTGGTLPLSMTICTQKIYDAFYSDDASKALYHGHSYTANPLACQAGVASLTLLQKTECQEQIRKISSYQKEFTEYIRHSTELKNRLVDVRHQGTVLALEMRVDGKGSYFHPLKKRAYDFFLSKGILLRPLGNVIYVMPPYCSSMQDLEETYKAIEEFMATLPRVNYECSY